MYFRYAKNLKVKDLQVQWEKPESAKWQSALYFQEVNGLKIEGFTGAPAKAAVPGMVLDQAEGAAIVNSHALPGTDLFLRVPGVKTRDINLFRNQLHTPGTSFN